MLKSFLNFDTLIGTRLIVLIYFFGLFVIAFAFLSNLFQGLKLFGSDFLQGVGSILGAVVAAVFAVLVWRFMYELFMLIFRISEDLRDIKNRP